MKFEYNFIIVAAIAAWFVAQLLKTILYVIKNKKFDAERLVGAGGFPSSHTALVVGATVAVLIEEGMGSSAFAVMLVLAFVVIYDAMGVRRAAGYHAREINKIMRFFSIKEIKLEIDRLSKKALDKKQGNDANDNTIEKYEPVTNEKPKMLKEFLGHTPFEVIGGAVLGIGVPLLVDYFDLGGLF